MHNKTPIILITGAAGFVGRHLQTAVEAAYPDAYVCILDHPSSGVCGSGSHVEQEGRIIRLSADLGCAEDPRLALEALVQKAGVPDMVFHLAAQAEVGRSFQAPSATYEVNVVGTARLLEALSDYTTTCRVLITSSAQVYAAPDGRAPVPGSDAAAAYIALLDESAPIRPASHYGVSKFAQEEVGRLFFETTGLPVLITRAFNHTGPGQGTGFVVPDFARQIALLEREAAGHAAAAAPTMRVGNLEARRDYLDVRDVVSAYLTVMAAGEPGRPYNVASGTTYSVRELLDLLLAEANIHVQVEVDPRLVRLIDVAELAGDASRLRALGWQPVHDLRTTIKETLDYWRRMTGARLHRRSGR